MSKKRDSREHQKNIKPKSRRRMQIGIFLAAVVIVIAVIFVPKKTANDTTAPPIAPMFKKQGELTFQKNDGKNIIRIDIEIADNESKREIGLMGRPAMGELEGMLFVFEQELVTAFWMKNTILPLDIIFIAKTGEIVTIHKNTKPFSEESYPATAVMLFVLEVNGGFTDKYGIKEGDRIVWKRN